MAACLLVAAVIGLGALSAPAWAGCCGGKETEKKVTIDQVPAAVKDTIVKEAGGNTITEIEEETKDGVTTYEAEWKADGKEIEIKVAADGKLLKKEVETDDGDDEDDDD
ncbi:MAG: hypothetical protein IMZ55_09970 [Acidobacteria bacterium]|nr:hypothetical protein [Acidobacteriota bacterium]